MGNLRRLNDNNLELEHSNVGGFGIGRNLRNQRLQKSDIMKRNFTSRPPPLKITSQNRKNLIKLMN